MADSQRKTANLASNLLINDTSAQYATILMFDADLEADTTYTLSFTASADIRMYMSEAIFTQATYLRTVEGVNTVTVTTKADLVKTSSNYQNGRWLMAKNTVEQSVSIDITNVMFNTGSTALPYEPYGWQHSLRKLTTATEAVENPLYSDGTAITSYTIKGNTVQNGTPTPSNPVEVNGVGERTENLLDMEAATDSAYINSLGEITYNDAWSISDYISVESLTTYTISRITDQASTAACHAFYDADKSLISTIQAEISTQTFETPTNAKYIRCSWRSATIQQVMLNTGSTAKPYEPYGYKIPILNGQTTTPIYLSEQLMKINDTADSLVSTGTVTYSIKKYVFTGNETFSEYGQSSQNDAYRFATSTAVASDISSSLASSSICTHFTYDTNWNNIGFSINNGKVYITTNTAIDATSLKQWLSAQYAAGTPLTIYYILATAETEQVTAPSIPTTDGANTISVDTTVQPSEFTATWTGWHDASVKEKSENIYNNIAENYGSGQYVNGEWQETLSRATSQMIPIEGDNSYNITLSGQIAALINFNYFDESYNWLGNRSTQGLEPTTDTQTEWNTTTLPNNARYLCFTFTYYGDRSRVISASDMITINIMVNKGQTALPYEPYWK